MRRPNLAQLLVESSRKAQEVLAHNRQVERITAAVKAQLAKRAETSKPMSCPHCGEPLPESWRTDDVTGDSTDNDDVNEQDDDDDDRELDAKGKS